MTAYPTNRSPVKFQKVEVWGIPANSFQDWVSTFLRRIDNLDQETGPNWLMGYSLGGRLALHVLLQKPSIWSGVIVISSHPGLKTNKERQEQCIRDDKWAQRFENETWSKLIEAWNRLPVFCNRSNPFLLEEGIIKRRHISRGFTVFSKGRQRYLVPELKELTEVPLLYIAGENDIKYMEIGAELARYCSSVTFKPIDAAGHRVPWENTKLFVDVVQKFIAEIG